VPADCEAAFITDPENRELVTVVATINWGGRRVPPMIIFKGAYHLRKYFDNDMDPNTYWARSESGYSNDRLGLKYLEHFDRFTKDSTRGKYRLLIFDGHGSHLTQEFVDYCWTHNIRPFRLPPHLTHILQPLDVGFFQILKRFFKQQVRREVFLGAQEVNKVDFFRFFQYFWNKAIKRTSAIQSAFTKCGLIPLNPTAVLQRVQQYGGRQTLESDNEEEADSDSSDAFTTPPHTPPSEPTFTDWPTPLTMRTRKKGIDYIRTRQLAAIEGSDPLTPSVIRVTDKLEKAAQSSMIKGALSTHRLHDLSMAAKRREVKVDGGKIVQKYGEIYGQQALRQIEEDRIEELKVVNIRNTRLAKKWKKIFQTQVLVQLKKRYRTID
jgi:hypothetical protein